ncbi:MAG TPA: hypothetical protein VM070_00780, partial [Candidatus Saccharimonadales bacterium]|nr:hypothetical protein [Candidatus Saccharimonadales bacterium]
MDERDKDLTHLFVRDLDEIPLPPRGAWRRTQEKEQIIMRTSRSLLTAGAAVAVLILALVVGLQLRDRSETAASPSASPRPSATASTAPGAVAPSPTSSSTASPTAAASAVPVLNDSFGLLVLEVGSSATIRTEGGTTVGTLNGVRFVVSPTGDRVAYITPEGRGQVVRIRTIAGGAERVTPSFAEGDNVTGLAWSTDGTGLLIASGQGSDTGPAPTTPARLQAYDIAGGTPTLVAMRQDGRIYAPIAWDRAARFIAAAETGAGGFASAYLTFDLSQTPARAKSVPIPGRASIPVASTDGKFALLNELDSKEVRYWPLADFAAIKVAGTVTPGALWQPGSHRIGFISGDAFVLFSADDGTTATVFRGVKTGSPTQPGATLRTFRIDGSAVVLGVPVGTGLGQTDYTLTRISDGASVTFQSTG